MALSYRLHLATELEPLQALNIAFAGSNLEWASSPDARLFGDGLLVGAYLEDDDGDRFMIEEAFGFIPTLSMWFRFVNTGDYYKAKSTMFQVTMKLLNQEVSGDAVLLFNGEIIELQRLKGQLLLNDDSRIINGKKLQPSITPFLSDIKLPYELRNLPSPLL